MSNYNTQRFSTPPYNAATTWTRPMIRSFRSFSSTQWQDRNDFVHGATVQPGCRSKTTQHISRSSLLQQHINTPFQFQ
jgi:hypothetical protein